ncbi:hypothetical protein C8Q74DRAFT_1364043 [Fomes fomentarius]|nr:hypothetical protein C8Q74DRAFT_1364043 [Fomes fomentarius]
MNPPALFQAYIEVIPVDRPSNARRRRLWQLLACVVLSIVGLHLLLGTNGPTSHVLRHIPYKYGPSQCSALVNWTAPMDHVGDFAHHASATVTLPLSAQQLHFVAEGSLQSGDFAVSHDSDVPSGFAVINVNVGYRHPDALEEATVCQTHPDDTTWGLGIFTPHWRAPHLDRNLKFHIRLRLPSTEPGAPLQLGTLSTSLPLFSHSLPDLADSVHFDSVRLKTENSLIKTESVTANRIWFSTKNGAIRGGRLTATSSLDLYTTNAPITVSASLVNDDSMRPSYLSLKTSNGRIDGEISLTSNTSGSASGDFRVVARSSNTPLTLTFVDAPADSALSLSASTSNAPTHVTLHKTFEGTFDLSSSSVFRPQVDWTPADDPTDGIRRRRVRLDTVKGSRVRGGISWVEGGEDRGQVVLETTNSLLRLTL